LAVPLSCHDHLVGRPVEVFFNQSCTSDGISVVSVKPCRYQNQFWHEIVNVSDEVIHCRTELRSSKAFIETSVHYSAILACRATSSRVEGLAMSMHRQEQSIKVASHNFFSSVPMMNVKVDYTHFTYEVLDP